MHIYSALVWLVSCLLPGVLFLYVHDSQNDAVYSSTTGRLTTGTPQIFHLPISDSLSNVEVDQYEPNTVVYHDGPFLRRWNKTKSQKIFIGHKFTGILQYNRSHWLVYNTAYHCIAVVNFFKNVAKLFIGCGKRGDRDGFGLDVKLDTPTDMIVSKFNKDQVMVTTNAKLKILVVSISFLFTPEFPGSQNTLPSGLAKMVWFENSLIIISSPFHHKLEFGPKGTLSAVFFSESNSINWQPKQLSNTNGYQSRNFSSATDVVPLFTHGVFLVLLQNGSLLIFDLLAKQTKVIEDINDCIGNHSLSLAFDRTQSEIVTAIPHNFCKTKVFWMYHSTTSTSSGTAATSNSTILWTTKKVDSTKTFHRNALESDSAILKQTLLVARIVLFTMLPATGIVSLIVYMCTRKRKQKLFQRRKRRKQNKKKIPAMTSKVAYTTGPVNEYQRYAVVDSNLMLSSLSKPKTEIH